MNLGTALFKEDASSLNRAVPKFMKRIKVPDYKDRSVFGVPLTVNVQRSGQPLPQSIQQAMRYLRNHCLDQVSTAACGSHSWERSFGLHGFFSSFVGKGPASTPIPAVLLPKGRALQEVRCQIPDPGSTPDE